MKAFLNMSVIELFISAILVLWAGPLVNAQHILADPGVGGAPVEIAHLFYDEWPTGM